MPGHPFITFERFVSFQAVLSEVIKFREAKKTLYKISDESQHQFDFLPWTAASGKHGIRDILIQLINAILKYGARSTGEPELRQRHYKNLTELVDFVLNSRKSYLDSITDSENHDVLTQQFEAQRSALIYHFGMLNKIRRIDSVVNSVNQL